MIVHPPSDDQPRVHPRSGRAATDAGAPNLSGIHVLAVDDEKDALSLVSDVLQAAGAHVTTANSAAEALAFIDTAVPDVLIADLGMPTIDGFALIERIRHHQNAAVQDLPAAALTAFARSDDRIKALRAGFDIHLAKPIEPAELMTTVAALASRSGNRRRGQ